MKKNLKRIFILLAFFTLFLTSCGVSNGKDAQESSKSNESNIRHLNVNQADLIAKITDNEKYLNPDLLYDIKGLDDSDKIGVIITLDTNGVVDDYFENSRGYGSVSEYAKSSNAKSQSLQMKKNQNTLIEHLISMGYIEKVNHTYTTLFNGFSATTTYGKYKELSKLGIVKKVNISEVYALPKTAETDNAVTNLVDVYETGIFNSSSVEYTGENTAVAVLDSGFDIHHTVFRSMPEHPMISKEDVSTVLANTTASGFTSGLKAEDVYVNEKIPFAYDYADKDSDVAPFDSEHGTHVAGIIGGNDDVITGVAVNTQLVLLKVFSDLTEGAKQEDILAALEDSVVLGVDAINMSLGTSCGFSRVEDNDYLNSVYDKIEAAGISLIVAASNDYSSGYGGENSNTNKTSNPDSATVGAPSTYPAALSVASISGTKSKYIKAEDGFVFFFNEANSSGTKPYDFYEMLNIPDNKDTIYEYVTVPGNGIRVNYAGIDVKGKVALVKRGENTFEEKARIAYENGAIACIIYNNIGGDILMSAGNDLKIPLCSISKDDGMRLAEKGTGKLYFNNGNLAGPFMSDFSSWGPNPDLKLKPEITAHGGNIKSSVPGGGYEELSGTSMASPNMCGIVVLIRQYLKEKFPQYANDFPTISKMANELLMSCATIALDQVGNPYSPRKQGAGLASLYNAVNTKAYLTVDGIDRAKIELGDDPKETGVYTLKFNINNISSDTLNYVLSNYTMTESVSTSDSSYVSEKAYMLNPTTSVKVSGAGAVSGNTITVNPNGIVEVEYTLTLSETEKKYIRSHFENGMYVEGFATLESKNEDKIDLSIPFLAFFGDWTVAPMFDKTYYDVETTAHDDAIDDEDKVKADYYATTPLGTYYYNYIIPLGSYVYTMDKSKYDEIPAIEEHAAIGYSVHTINGITCIYAGLLRNAEKMTYTITDTITGEVVYEHVSYNVLKAHSNGGRAIPGYDMLDISIADLGLSNNTNYTFTMIGELAYGDGGLENNLNNSFSFTFYVDYEAPVITDAQFYSTYDKNLKKDKYFIDVYVYDNHYTQSIRPFTIIDGEFTSLGTYPIPVYGSKGSINKVTMEITDYMDLLQYSTNSSGELGIVNGLGIMVDDYAMNGNYYFVTLPGTDADEFKFVNEEGKQITSYTIEAGQEIDLAKMLSSNDPLFDASNPNQSVYMSKLSWTSTRDSILMVKNGKAEGIASGVAKVTVSGFASDGMKYSASITIIVKPSSTATQENTQRIFNNNATLEEMNFTYFETLKAFIPGPERSEIGETGDKIFFTDSPNISCYPSEMIKIFYEIKPWNLDPDRYELEWSSTNDSVATVDENGVVTALKKGSATIMLRITVDGKQSNILARTRVTVKSEFIVEGRILTGYKGVGGAVEIPDDLGIMYIGSYAFALYTTDMDVKVDETDWDANKTAGGNTAVTSVVIPYDVMEVQKYAFYNCTELEKVTFLVGPKGETCKNIRPYAFMNDTKLKEINSENIQVIGESAFQNCTGLETFDFSKIYAIGKYAFKGCTELQSVDLTTLRNVWTEAFADCTKLKTVTSGEFTNFSEAMFKNTAIEEMHFYADRIPTSAFENCQNLKKVVVYNDIIYVGSSAFKGCAKLENIEIKGSCDFIYNNAFSELPIKIFTLPNSSIMIEESAFSDCELLEKVVFSKNTFIKDNLGTTFENCTSLTTFEVSSENEFYSANGSLLLNKDGNEIVYAAVGAAYGDYTIPNEITSIFSGAFSGVLNLTSINLNQVTQISNYAFSECKNLTDVTFPSQEFSLGEGAFAGCTKLEAVTNLTYTKEIGAYAFDQTAISSVTLGNDVVVFEGAFAENSALINVTMGENVQLGKYAFAQCDHLQTVVSGDHLVIGEYAFGECFELENIDLSKAVGSIGAYAFVDCSNLTTANLVNITEIEEFAFADCSNLSSLNISNVEYIGKGAFGGVFGGSGIAVTNLTLPTSLTYVGDYAFYGCPSLRTVTISNSCDVLSYAFADCVNLEKVTLGEEIDYIENYVFAYDTSLTTINTGNIVEIGVGAFKQCESLNHVDLRNVVYVGEEAFYGCESLTAAELDAAIYIADAAFLACENLTTITIPNVMFIGEQALSMIAVEVITLPKTLEYVAPTAFYNNENQTAFVYTGNVDNYVLNDYACIIDGVLYTTSNNGQRILSAYPTGKTTKEFVVAENTVQIELFAATNNKYLEKIVFPDSIKIIRNMSFYGCEKLNAVEFRSTTAPILEGSPMGKASDYDYSEDSPIYKLLNKYLNLNGYYPYYYGQFKAMVGTIEPLTMFLPSNSGLEGYNSVLYELYFDVANATKTEFVARDKNTIAYLEKIQLVPTENITIKDEKVIADARNAYNSVRQNLTLFGYSKEELSEMLERLVYAEGEITKIKEANLQKKYQDLLEDIAALKSFSLDQVDVYKELVTRINAVNKDDRKLIDTSNVDNFGAQYMDFLNKLDQDITDLDKVSQIPTPDQSSKIVYKVILVQNFFTCIALFALGKRWF